MPAPKKSLWENIKSTFQTTDKGYQSTGAEQSLAKAAGVYKKPQQPVNYLKFKNQDEYDTWKYKQGKK